MIRHILPPSMQGLWFLSQTDCAVSAAYNIVLAFRMSEMPDVERLENALQLVQRRHEALRCAFPSEQGVPWCEVFEPQDAPVWSLSRALGQVSIVAQEEGERPFSIDKAPLARAVLVDEPDTGTFNLVLSFPHLVFDDASARILLNDLAQAYSLQDGWFTEVPSPSLLSAMAQEQGFVASQKAKNLAAAAVERLAGIPDFLVLPTSRGPSENAVVYPGAVVRIGIDQLQHKRIAAFARVRRTTVATVYLATWMLLLWKYSGQSDFGVCMPVSRRSEEADQHVIGYLTNLAVLRASVQPTQTVDAFVLSVAEQVWDVLESCELPFPLLTKQLQRRGTDLQGPLLQVAFNHTVTDSTAESSGPPLFRKLDVSPRFVKNQIKLDLLESPDGMRAFLLYDREGIHAEVAGNMARTYSVLLNALLEDGQAMLQHLPVIDASQCKAILSLSRGVTAPFPRKCLHQLVEQQAQQSPDAIAVSFGAMQLSYRQLNARANQLARRLLELHVGRESIVAVCIERSLEMVVALLGVLKAGAAYLPVDPTYPLDRIGYMLNDSSAAALLTQSGMASTLHGLKLPMLLLDSDDSNGISTISDIDLDLPCTSAELAYCIYTSGSTGKPKGALNSHEATVNRLHWMQQAYGLTASDVVLQKTSFCFDVSVWELFWPLIVGARLCVAEPGIHRDPVQLNKTIMREGVTTLHFVPPMLHAYLDTVVEPPHTLRRIFCSGEALPLMTAQACRRQLPAVMLHNLYGPTECAVDVTFWSCPDQPEDKILIGRPIANTEIHILDELCQRVPVGAIGELYIGGTSVGRGYLNRPDLTAEKFIPNPFGAPGSRMYRTGDQARWLTDGNLEFLGRIDCQVKIRGFRIELGEVEAGLLRCDGVKEAVVIAREDALGDKRLVGYVVAPGAKRDALLKQLTRTIPEYMLPSVWVFLDALPLNANGKTDRRSLPAPDLDNLHSAAQFIAPRNALEEQIAAIWARVLGAKRIGVQDNFFALGGHSLLAMQVSASLRQDMGVELSMKALFDNPTVDALAAVVATRQQQSQFESADAPIVRLARVSR